MSSREAQKGNPPQFPEEAHLRRKDLQVELGGAEEQPRGVSKDVSVPQWERVKSHVLAEFPSVNALDVEALFGRLDELAALIARRSGKPEADVRERVHQIAREAEPWR